MDRFTGKLYEAHSASRREAVVQIDEDGTVDIDGHVVGHWQALRVSDRIGDIPRRLTLPDGRMVETPANDIVDLLETRLRPQDKAGLLHRLEAHWRWAGTALTATLLIGWLTVGYGIPAAAGVIAQNLPRNILELTGRHTLTTLDHIALSPSKLDAAQSRAVEALLQRAGFAASPGYPFKLALRDGGRIGPNAFALPDGTIVMTDQLVKLAENDEQIIAVFAHEIGHVQKCHGMQRLVQSSAMGALALFVLGDVSQAISAMPAMMLESAYSRDFEREADDYAAQLLRQMDISPSQLARFLEHMETSQKNDPAPGWLSTHPPTPERVKALGAS